MRRVPLALVCINNAEKRMTRWARKVTGGFWYERFDIVDEDAFRRSCTPETIEGVRRGKMRDQVDESRLQDQLA